MSEGLKGLGQGFVEAQVGFVVAHQQADGGFAGRLGGSDLYYTDFALRILTLLAPQHPAIPRAGQYLSRQDCIPRDLVECFSILNANRLLLRCNHAVVIHEPAVRDRIGRYLLPFGGLTRTPGNPNISAYNTFLGALCYACMQMEMPLAPGAVQAVMDLRRPDLGFAEMPGQGCAQTNATAAAAGFLGLCDALSEDLIAAITQYLASMQTPAGGLRAHAAVADGDLLSTFTGLLTLATFEQLNRVDVAAVARFIRSTACSSGGFRACAMGDDPDIEYTYYGLGSLALMRLHGQSQLSPRQA
ncbi:MAG: prenyltransferase/squalene oxidase repeat-containing protein [Bacillota bacterium]